jgi:hypothetical protein
MIAVLAALGLASAQEHHFRHEFEDGVAIETDGHLREMLVLPGALVVDADGTEVGQGLVVDQRLRSGLALTWRGLRIATEWDLFTGQVGGDTWDFQDVPDYRARDRFTAFTGEGFVPRRLSIGFSSPEGLAFEAGLVPAAWGLGVLANNGTREPLFGRLDRGDRMIRIRTSFAPFKRKGELLPIFATIAFDQVVEDDLAHWSNQQRAQQVIASVLYRHPEGQSLGMFFTFRAQQEPGDALRPTQAAVLDLYGETPIALPKDWSLRVGAELAGITGRTQYVLSYGNQDSTRILSGAAAVEFEAHAPKDLVVLHVRGGASSATGDPDAGVLRDFTFDPNYNVGMVLFDEVMGGIEAGTYNLLNDKENAGRVPLGADLLVSEGSVRRSAYLQPAVVVKPPGPVDFKVGMVAGWSTGPVAQGFYTFRAGGDPRNHLDQPTDGHYLGTELDWGVGIGRSSDHPNWWFRPRFSVEGGHAFLSKNLGGGVVHTILATGRVDW